MAYIGVKLANGEFYPIFEETTPAKKKLVVTTVNDNQPNVQIDLYRGEPGFPVDDTSYIGSLLVNDIARAPKGVPDIELDVTLKDDMTLEAFAQDKVSGGQSKFSITLTELPTEHIHEVPQFDIQETETLIDDSLLDSENQNVQASLDELEIEEPITIDQSELDALEMELAEPEAEPKVEPEVVSGELAAESDLKGFAESETLSLDELTNIENSSVFPQEEQTIQLSDEFTPFEEISESEEELPASEIEDNAEFNLGEELTLEVPQSEESQTMEQKTASILEESEETSYLGPDTISFDVELPKADLEEPGDEEIEEISTETADTIPSELEFELQEAQESTENFSSSELALETEPLGLEEETVFSVEEPRATDVSKKEMRQDRKQAQKIVEESDRNEKKPCAPLWCKILVPLAIILLATVIVLLIGRCSAAQRDAGVAQSSKPVLEQPLVKPDTTQKQESESSGETANQGSAATTAETGTTASGTSSGQGETSTVPGVQQGQQTGQQTGQTSAPAQVQPAQTTQQTKPSTSTKPPKPAPGSKTPGVWYKIRWGDTLWDLSIAFYRIPWKYMKIYNANRKLIKHPDKIISGTWIYVPK